MEEPVPASLPVPSVRPMVSSGHVEVGVPRETRVLTRYLPDPSLRYAKVPLAGTSLTHGVLLWLLGGLSAAALIVPIWRLITDRVLVWGSLAAVGGLIGLALCLPVLPRVTAQLAIRAFFARAVRSIEVGLDRAVFQPGNTFRYEVHMPAQMQLELHEVHIRLVFWESWYERRPARWWRLRRFALHKQGHDLVRHSISPIALAKSEHAVIRGEMRVPMTRPSEHHRGKRKHVSYVNLTVTLMASDKRRFPVFRGECPRLITFPWM